MSSAKQWRQTLHVMDNLLEFLHLHVADPDFFNQSADSSANDRIRVASIRINFNWQ
jgi:hypothetical protein